MTASSAPGNHKTVPRDVPAKAATAFRTIGEVSRDTGLPAHILRYWETRFVQLRPVQRAGNRRYYRPEDVALVRRIDQLLSRDGYTMRGVQQLLSGEGTPPASPSFAAGTPLQAIRTLLIGALADDEAARSV